MKRVRVPRYCIFFDYASSVFAAFEAEAGSFTYSGIDLRGFIESLAWED